MPNNKQNRGGFPGGILGEVLGEVMDEFGGGFVGEIAGELMGSMNRNPQKRQQNQKNQNMFASNMGTNSLNQKMSAEDALRVKQRIQAGLGNKVQQNRMARQPQNGSFAFSPNENYPYVQVQNCPQNQPYPQASPYQTVPGQVQPQQMQAAGNGQPQANPNIPQNCVMSRSSQPIKVDKGVAPEKLREAIVWSEILGEPACKKRHRRR